MTDRESRLLALATQLSDGVAIDWTAAESASGDDEERAQVQRLRAISELSREDAADDATRSDRVPTQWGPLTVLEQIGSGRFGDVYRARDVRLERDVALKLLRHRAAGESDSQVVDEGRLLARVRHPNVVAVHGAERIGDRVGVWMELVRGRTLEQELAVAGTMSPERAGAVCADVCRALAAVHRAGLVHRDVKAANVIRADDGRIVLMDFGAGRDLSDVEEIGLAGTPLYLAPEVIAGRSATPPSDVYSAGVLLVHLVTGTYPVSGRSLAEIRAAPAARDPSQSPVLDALPPDLSAVARRALAARPDRRYASADEMADALQASLTAPMSARPRYRVAIVAIALLTAALLLGRLSWSTTRETVGPGNVGTMQPVCADCGDDESVVSADGRAMVGFDEDHLAVRMLESGKTRRIRAVPEGTSGFGVWPALSPDSRHVAFVWLDDRAEFRTLDLARADGHSRVLAAQDVEFWPLGWRPDGSAILVKSLREDRTAALEWIEPVTRTRRMFKELGWRSDGFDRTAISPDGRFVVYSALPSNPEKPPIRASRGSPRPSAPTEQHLFIRAVDGSSDVPLVSAGVNRAPIWSPSGARLFYIRRQAGGSTLMSMPMRDGRPDGPAVVVSDDVQNVTPVGVTTAGQYYFAKRVRIPARSVIYSTNPSTAGQVLDDLEGSRATWSPDGRHIASIRRPTEDHDNASLDVVTLENRLKITYAIPSRLATNPALWFAGSQALLVEIETEAGLAWARWDLDVPGDSPKPLTRNRDDARYVTNRGVRALSPDGRTLYFGAYGTGDEKNLLARIVALDLTNGRYHDVFRLPGERDDLPGAARELAIAISPDGRALAIHTIISDTQARLAVVNVDGSSYREICAPRPAPPAVRERLVWTRHGDTLIFTEGGGPQRFRIMRVPAHGGVPEFTGVALDNLEVLDASPDGTRVLASRGEVTRFEIWSLNLPR